MAIRTLTPRLHVVCRLWKVPEGAVSINGRGLHFSAFHFMPAVSLWPSKSVSGKRLALQLQLGYTSECVLPSVLPSPSPSPIPSPIPSLGSTRSLQLQAQSVENKTAVPANVHHKTFVFSLLGTRLHRRQVVLAFIELEDASL